MHQVHIKHVLFMSIFVALTFKYIKYILFFFNVWPKLRPSLWVLAKSSCPLLRYNILHNLSATTYGLLYHTLTMNTYADHLKNLPYSHAVPSQLHCDYMATANFDMFPRYSILLSRLSRQLLLGCLVIVDNVIKKN